MPEPDENMSALAIANEEAVEAYGRLMKYSTSVLIADHLEQHGEHSSLLDKMHENLDSLKGPDRTEENKDTPLTQIHAEWLLEKIQEWKVESPKFAVDVLSKGIDMLEKFCQTYIPEKY
jgi:hypothetical protein